MEGGKGLRGWEHRPKTGWVLSLAKVGRPRLAGQIAAARNISREVLKVNKVITQSPPLLAVKGHWVERPRESQE